MGKEMNCRPTQPIIYEVNTWVWLREIGERINGHVTLGTVPAVELDRISSLGVDAIWLMGVWERSPRGTEIAGNHPGLKEEFHKVLPDLSPADVVGSPYSIRRYVVANRLGGHRGLASFREMLKERNIKLILDIVPNHVATDHPWVFEHPEFFIRGTSKDMERDPGGYFEAGGKVIAHGRDPYFPAWTDTAQLNSGHQGLRQAMIETVLNTADQCDGVRCDMAMLVMNSVLERTWRRSGVTPSGPEFWPTLIDSVRREAPDFIFMAEAYWDSESDLLDQGFDYVYDKGLYDRLVQGRGEEVRRHLAAHSSHLDRLVHFIENHDEPRAASIFSPDRLRSAAVVCATLPGARLFHEGQFEGRKIRLPVQLGRRPQEPVDDAVRVFYHRLLGEITSTGFRESEWALCDQEGWPDNGSHLNLASWCLRGGEKRWIVVVNLSDQRSQGRIRLPWADLANRTHRLIDTFSGEVYERGGNEMLNPGLFVDLRGWGFHFLKFQD